MDPEDYIQHLSVPVDSVIRPMKFPFETESMSSQPEEALSQVGQSADLTSPEVDTNSTLQASPMLASTEILKFLSDTAASPMNRRAPLLSMPTELHLLIFSHLDPIDSTCFGLSHPSFYPLHRVSYPKPISLSTRRRGPNLLESAWELVGLENHGHQSCRHCGPYRCQLHMHLDSWMPKDQEYCVVRERFGQVAKGSGERCYRSCPPKPGVCGRHTVKDGAREKGTEASKL